MPKTFKNFLLSLITSFSPLNAELNPVCHLLALLGGATIVVVSRLRVKKYKNTKKEDKKNRLPLRVFFVLPDGGFTERPRHVNRTK
jgi:hypothetical protein